MTTNTRGQGTRAPGTQQPGRGQSGMGQSAGSLVARGGSALAASVLFLLGVYHFFTGIAAFARSNFYTVGANYPYHASNTTWGWLHVIGGILLAITGLALFRGQTWARWIGITLASLSIVLNFFFLPYFPLWALVMIPIAFFAIWAIARDGSEQREREMMAQRGMAGAFGGQTGQPGERREPVGAYAGAQTGQRWPENVGREQQQPQGAGERRNWSPSDVKAGQAGQQTQGQQMQERAQQGASSSAQSGRNSAEQAADRARQSANRDYRSGS
jgi:hypothetical protein